jgi:hypothetical protein
LLTPEKTGNQIFPLSESTTLKRFRWVDRDTFARDLLQLVYHAPPELRSLALQLLSAARSMLAIEPLSEIACHDDTPIDERQIALRTLTTIPEDIYLPQLSKFFTELGDEPYALRNTNSSIFQFATVHRSNQRWLWEKIDSLTEDQQHKFFQKMQVAHISKECKHVLLSRMLALWEKRPYLFEQDLVGRLLFWSEIYDYDETIPHPEKNFDLLIETTIAYLYPDLDIRVDSSRYPSTTHPLSSCFATIASIMDRRI